ncbi:EF-P beta-lysylation protein EpmB [Psychrobacter sp.]|uniref:EF-P beta-lysylation protein EpmB n=1 Tax=Psychrobacter sp. TaxID=56811 RepID=UPI0025F3F8E6|nr:EF-P beta-lysylation protein EpmB [Psychrobacter sp.]
MINHLPEQKNRKIPITSVATGLSELNSIDNFEGRDKHNAPTTCKKQVADIITDIDQLLAILELSHIKPELYLPEGFGLRVPNGFVAKMKKGDPKDPLLLQVLPSKLEQIEVNGYEADPLAENDHNPVKGLLHKYHSRVLVTVTGACAIHCRYCFRQHFDYQSNLPKSDQIEMIQEYIRQHPEIREVLLSGGDPLSISNRRFFLWLDALEALPQINTIRIHTRLPIVIPERLDLELLLRMQESRCRMVMVVHTNHSNEIDAYTAQCLQQVKQYGVTLLNQTVLLAGINDSIQAQVELSERLFESGVLPYYLHLLDKVQGAAHFDIQKQKAVDLYWQMLEQLPGYLVPKLVQELPNRPFKTPVDLYRP